MNHLQCFSSKFVGKKCGKGWCHWEILALLKLYHTTALVIIFWCLWVVEFWENECIRCQNDINFWGPSYSKSFCCSFSPAHPSPSVKTCCLELIGQLTELGKQMSELQECSILLMWIMRKGIILNLSDFWFFFCLLKLTASQHTLWGSWTIMATTACLQYICLNECLHHVCFLKTKTCCAKIGEIILRHVSTNCLVTYGGLSLELMHIFTSTFVNDIISNVRKVVSLLNFSGSLKQFLGCNTQRYFADAKQYNLNM